jgi:hypothetical protein
MSRNLGLLGPKGTEMGTYRTTFIYQGPFKEDSSTGSRVINEVVLEGVFSEVRIASVQHEEYA